MRESVIFQDLKTWEKQFWDFSSWSCCDIIGYFSLLNCTKESTMSVMTDRNKAELSKQTYSNVIGIINLKLPVITIATLAICLKCSWIDTKNRMWGALTTINLTIMRFLWNYSPPLSLLLHWHSMYQICFRTPFSYGINKKLGMLHIISTLRVILHCTTIIDKR